MILVDTSVWIGHLREQDPRLTSLLERTQVLGHPWVTGELALGTLRNRGVLLELLTRLPQAEVADVRELARSIELHDLGGRGIGYLDAGLLAATLLTPDALLWTGDRRLERVARELGCALVAP